MTHQAFSDHSCIISTNESQFSSQHVELNAPLSFIYDYQLLLMEKKKKKPLDIYLEIHRLTDFNSVFKSI